MGGRTSQLDCVDPGQEYSKKSQQNVLFCSRRTHFVIHTEHAPLSFPFTKGNNK